MRERFLWALIFVCFGSLFLACYAPVLFQGRQFGYRDAAHYYYPLYQRVQAEWDAGRWPLWEPEENAGMPLLGNPTAAVLYPGKIVYALFSYPWAARLYIVGHTVLAFAAMLALMRSWGTSWTGSAISALSYAFGAPILFQYCNIIFLVGAAWLPLGLRAIDRWLRLGRRFGLLELALVLAMQTLGGDLEVAYVTGLCAGGYAIGLAWLRVRPLRQIRFWPLFLGFGALVLIWSATALVLAARLPSMRPDPSSYPPRAFAWMVWVPTLLAALWGMAGVILLIRWRRAKWNLPFATMLAGLACAGTLGGALAAAQLLPAFEFSRQSGRVAGEGSHDIYPFSLEPIRALEFLWPNFYGTAFAYNRNWLLLMPPRSIHSEVWTPSLYMGGLTIALAVGAAGLGRAQPWRGWLTMIIVVSVLASLGKFTSPLWWGRWSPPIAKAIGPHDPPDVGTIRLDRYLRDGDGGFYWALATTLPGFKQFRYPGKLLTFTVVAIAALAGMGWDRWTIGRSKRTSIILSTMAILSLTALVIAVADQGRITQRFESWGAGAGSSFGPFDAPGAYQELRRSLLQASVLLTACAALFSWGRRMPRLAAALALVIVTADLGLANVRYVLTVPQALLEGKPRVVQMIEDAERAQPTPGPFRIHRMKSWAPFGWQTHASPDRVRDFVTWERETIQPKYGLGYDLAYTSTSGFAELYDYEWFFGPFLFSANEEAAKALRVKRGEQIVVYPRRGFDLWNTRYFVIPAHPGDWKDGNRGYASFLPLTTQVYPEKDAFSGSGGDARREEWALNEDFQIVRNLSEYPRAWVVHSARWLPPIHGMGRVGRDRPIQEILFQNDPFWSDPSRAVYDPKVVAWLDTDDTSALNSFLPGPIPGSHEPVTVTIRGPQRVELDAVLERPGLVVLADVFYPGWKLTIDGLPAPIYKANRMMRGAAVGKGKHHLVYIYEPRSFQVGGIVTIGAIVSFLAVSVFFARRPSSILLSSPSSDQVPDLPAPANAANPRRLE